MVYIAKDLVHISLLENAYKPKEQIKKLTNFEAKLDSFLSHSQFEKISSINNIFKL